MYGTNHPMLVKFFVSNDFCHVGEFLLPTGGRGPRLSEPQTHAGDCFLFIEEGPITVLLNESGDVFNVRAEEGMFIPENTSYQLINYTAGMVKAIFCIAPNL